MVLGAVKILDHFPKLASFTKWNNAKDIDPEDESCYTTQYQDVFLNYVDNQYSCLILKMSFYRGSTILGPAYWVNKASHR